MTTRREVAPKLEQNRYLDDPVEMQSDPFDSFALADASRGNERYGPPRRCKSRHLADS